MIDELNDRDKEILDLKSKIDFLLKKKGEF